MGISGYEAFVLVSISPVLLAGPLRSVIVSNLRIIHVLSLAGVAAYLVIDPVYRLFTVGFGVALATLGWVGTLYAESIHETRFESKLLGLMVGLILSSTAKFAWQTNNPIWPIMHAANGGWNATGLVLGILAALRFTRRAPLTSGSAPDSKLGGSALLAAFGVGGLFFGLHSLLSDTSTMILWVWEGFPIRGPYFSTHGWCTLAAMSLGLFTGISKPSLAGSWPQYAIGTAGAMVLTFFSHWTGYYGGLVIAFYLMAVAVPLISTASKKSPATTFGLGFGIYIFLVLFHVWVVAYAFVPGGPLVREHTDWIMYITMGLIGAGVFNYNSSQPKRQQPRRSSPSQHKKYFAVSTLIVNILFLCAAFKRFPTNDYKPYHAEDRVLTAGIWTIHFSLDNDMWSSEYRMRDLIKELELDVVGLLESDLQRIIMGNRDTTQFLAEDLGMYVDYGPGPNKHTWGAALLSKFPIVESKHHFLPSPVAPAVRVPGQAYGLDAPPGLPPQLPRDQAARGQLQHVREQDVGHARHRLHGLGPLVRVHPVQGPQARRLRARQPQHHHRHGAPGRQVCHPALQRRGRPARGPARRGARPPRPGARGARRVEVPRHVQGQRREGPPVPRL